MLKKKGLLLIFLSTLVIFLTTMTYAWISYFNTNKDVILEVGNILYEVDTNLDTSKAYYPGDDLGNINIINKSTIDTQVRVKIEYLINDVLFDYQNDTDSLILFNLNANLKYNETDKYFYYNELEEVDENTIYTFEIPSVDDTTNGVLLNIIDSIILNGERMDNGFKNASISIKIYFQIKQKDHLEWIDCDTLNFETGVKNG